MEWVRTAFRPTSKDGEHHDANSHLLAGGSFFHVQPYSFLPTNRSSWHASMRIYNSGFRCVADLAPAGLVRTTAYRVVAADPPSLVSPRRDLYLTEPIRLEPTGCTTLGIRVPWFPESVWYLDCPEGNWGPFGGAGTWPDKSPDVWEVPWVVEDGGRRASYLRRSGNQSVRFTAVVDGATVRYEFDLEGMPRVLPSSLCFKTFSPFFSSQERGTQVGIGPDGIRHVNRLPIPPDSPVSFFWHLGEAKPPERAALQSYDGTARVLFPEAHLAAAGNGWVPCTHLAPGKAAWGRGGGKTAHRHFGGSFSFVFAE
jgi:hypothetical protein